MTKQEINDRVKKIVENKEYDDGDYNQFKWSISYGYKKEEPFKLKSASFSNEFPPMDAGTHEIVIRAVIDATNFNNIRNALGGMELIYKKLFKLHDLTHISAYNNPTFLCPNSPYARLVEGESDMIELRYYSSLKPEHETKN